VEENICAFSGQTFYDDVKKLREKNSLVASFLHFCWNREAIYYD